MFCVLHEGNPDPDIELTKEFSWDDLPEEERINTLMFECDFKVEDAIEAFRKRRGLE